MVTEKQAVIQLMEQALAAYNSPNRAHYPLHGRTVSNLEAVSHYLTKACQLAPERVDLQLTLANIYSFSGQHDLALANYNQAHRIQPENLDALTYLCLWHHHQKSYLAYSQHHSQLEKISPERAHDVEQLTATLTRLCETQICYQPRKQFFSEKRALVTLGRVLNDDGSMTPDLLERLKLTLTCANNDQEALIFVTGGVAKAGMTEAQVMAEWLISQGIGPSRIIEEPQSCNTIENALFSLPLLEQHGIAHATLVSSSIHVHRTLALFEISQWRSGNSQIEFDSIAVSDGLSTSLYPEEKVKRDLYIDALRAYGLSAFDCAPFFAK